MFKVKHKHDGKVYVVYHVRITTHHDIRFTIFSDGCWYEWDADEFAPEED